MDSPALSVYSLSDEELEKYFENYVPLSNLPTPPPTRDTELKAALEEVIPSFDVAGAASHLINLVPSNVTSRPSPTTIQRYLNFAKLPQEVIGFAACILNALSPAFAPSWQSLCVSEIVYKQGHWKSTISFLRKGPVSSEVIILSSLVLAYGFLAEGHTETGLWASEVGAGQFTTKQMNATTRAILQDIDYGLLRFTAGMVEEQLQEMKTVGKTSRKGKEKEKPKLSIDLPRATVVENGLYTPGPSP